MKYVAAAGLVALALALVVAGLYGPREPVGKYTRIVADYSIPDITLVNQDGAEVHVTQVLCSDKPVFVDFVYATCTTISPVLAAGFASFQKALGPESRSVQLVSITIDPESDTPEARRDFLRRYRAEPGWDFFSGRREDIETLMKAFDAYIPDKESHFPVTFLKRPGREGWVRMNGLAGKSDLLQEYRKMVNAEDGDRGSRATER